jgi:hypothetical protein
MGDPQTVSSKPDDRCLVGGGVPYGLPNTVKARLGPPSRSTVPSWEKPIRQYGYDAIGSPLVACAARH